MPQFPCPVNSDLTSWASVWTSGVCKAALGVLSVDRRPQHRPHPGDDWKQDLSSPRPPAPLTESLHFNEVIAGHGQVQQACSRRSADLSPHLPHSAGLISSPATLGLFLLFISGVCFLLGQMLTAGPLCGCFTPPSRPERLLPRSPPPCCWHSSGNVSSMGTRPDLTCSPPSPHVYKKHFLNGK